MNLIVWIVDIIAEWFNPGQRDNPLADTKLIVWNYVNNNQAILINKTKLPSIVIDDAKLSKAIKIFLALMSSFSDDSINTIKVEGIKRINFIEAITSGNLSSLNKEEFFQFYAEAFRFKTYIEKVNFWYVVLGEKADFLFKGLTGFNKSKDGIISVPEGVTTKQSKRKVSGFLDKVKKDFPMYKDEIDNACKPGGYAMKIQKEMMMEFNDRCRPE